MAYSLLGILVLFTTLPFLSRSETYYTTIHRDDSDSGLVESPFGTLKRAVDSIRCGDICPIMSSALREMANYTRSGERAVPIRFVAVGNVILNGTLNAQAE